MASYDYFENYSISIVHDKDYRNFAGFEYNTIIGVVRNVIFKMTKLVEEKLKLS